MPHRAALHVCHTCGIAVKRIVCHWCVMAREDLHFRLRLPEDLKARIETAAEQSRRSMTAEIVARLEQSFEHPRAPGLADMDELRQMQEELRVLLHNATVRSEMRDRLQAREEPERYYERALELGDDLPEDDRETFKRMALSAVRRATGNPDWLPDDQGNGK